jgi:phage-related minor tail protein
LAALGNETGLISKLFTPMGLAIGGAAAALGLFVKAVMDGEEEMSAFNKALISTGGYAGVTAEQLNGMAESMAGGAVTIGKAREAITALATSGRFTGAQIGILAQATVDAGELMGQSVKQVVAEFTKLQESPVKASEALNEQYHYLTASVLQQIIALQNQGDTIGAANLAMTTYADTLRTRTAEAATQLGTLQRAWDSVKQSASFAWNAMEGVGVSSTPLSDVSDKYTALLKEYTAVADLAAGNKPGFFGSGNLPLSLQKGASGSFGMFSSGPTQGAISGA